MMNSDIQIIEKPDWVSWDEIKQCLIDAHAVNRAKAINMAHYQWPVEKIRDSITPNGVMLVALDGKKVVGTAAISEKQGKSWYAKGRYAYLGFAGVLTEYSGRGIYKKLTSMREKIAMSQGYEALVFDTHERNKKIQDIAQSNGYRKVSFFRAKSNDHYNIVMAKWLNGCPYSKIYCRIRYFLSYLRAHARGLLHTLKTSD